MKGQSRLAFGAGVICFLAFAGLYFATKIWMPIMWGLILPGAVGFIFCIVNERRKISEFFMMKSTKHGLNMGALVLIVFVLLAGVNYLSAKHSAVFDLSGNKINTLSDQSNQLISALDQTLNLRFFYKNGSDRVDENKKSFRDLVKKYPEKITVSKTFPLIIYPSLPLSGYG